MNTKCGVLIETSATKKLIQFVIKATWLYFGAVLRHRAGSLIKMTKTQLICVFRSIHLHAASIDAKLSQKFRNKITFVQNCELGICFTNCVVDDDCVLQLFKKKNEILMAGTKIKNLENTRGCIFFIR